MTSNPPGVGQRAARQLQATVRHLDPTTGRGEVLLDDGHVLGFDLEALRHSGIRALRPGQRVRARLDASGGVEAMTLATFPLPADD